MSSCRERGPLFVVVHRLLIAVTSLVVEHSPWSAASVAVAHGLCCSLACGIFLDQGLNPWPLNGRQILNHWATKETLSVECNRTHDVVACAVFAQLLLVTIASFLFSVLFHHL